MRADEYQAGGAAGALGDAADRSEDALRCCALRAAAPPATSSRRLAPYSARQARRLG